MDSTTAERIRQLAAAGMGQRGIAAEVGVTRWAVRTVLADEPEPRVRVAPLSHAFRYELPDEPPTTDLALYALAGRLAMPARVQTRKSTAGRPRKSAESTSRMLKVECPGCGCILRMTRTWIERAGLPTCGCGTGMRRA